MPRKVKDMSGEVFGRLTVIGLYEPEVKTRPAWYCKCECGNICIITGNNLRQGRTRSCGCLGRGSAMRSHGQSNTKPYQIYLRLKARCYNPKYREYKSFGGKGIQMCDRWIESYENFIQDMGDLPTPEHGLKRYDRNGNYEPKNCYWHLTGDKTVVPPIVETITFNNRTMCISDWSVLLKVSPELIKYRKDQGWSARECLFGKGVNK